MKIKELMIGDFVKFTDNDGAVYSCKVAGLINQGAILTGDDDLQLDVFDDYLESVEPVTITLEILLRNGFAKKSDVSFLFDTYILRTEKDEFGMSRTIVSVTPIFDLAYYVRVERVCDDPKLGRHTFKVVHPNAQYIHQLQQIYRLLGIEIDWTL